MKKFIMRPDIDLHLGVKVYKDTNIEYKNDRVDQVIKDLKLETIIDTKETTGFNKYESKTYLKIDLNEGDILLFEEERGYYLPSIPMITIDEAINDITVLKHLDKE